MHGGVEEGIEIAGIRSGIGHRRPPLRSFQWVGVMDGGREPAVAGLRSGSGQAAFFCSICVEKARAI